MQYVAVFYYDLITTNYYCQALVYFHSSFQFD